MSVLPTVEKGACNDRAMRRRVLRGSSTRQSCWSAVSEPTQSRSGRAQADAGSGSKNLEGKSLPEKTTDQAFPAERGHFRARGWPSLGVMSEGWTVTSRLWRPCTPCQLNDLLDRHIQAMDERADDSCIAVLATTVFAPMSLRANLPIKSFTDF